MRTQVAIFAILNVLTFSNANAGTGLQSRTEHSVGIAQTYLRGALVQTHNDIQSQVVRDISNNVLLSDNNIKIDGKSTQLAHNEVKTKLSEESE